MHVVIPSSRLHADFTKPPLLLPMPWAHVLAASNDSAAGLHAVGVARSLITWPGATLTVVTALSRPGEDPPRGLWPFAPVVAHGVPGIEIVRVAEQVGADLLVLGRQVFHQTDGPTLGPTADMVVRRSRIPCLFIPVGQERFDHCVVALDGTPRGFGVVDAAREFHRLAGGSLAAVMVEPVDPDGPGSVPKAGTLAVAGRLARYAGGNGMPLRVLHGDPVEALLATLTDNTSDLLVVGARRGGPGGASVGSGVGRHLLFTARCAVLTVPL
jgi:nucleotide-binding universal stress UspA family protein